MEGICRVSGGRSMLFPTRPNSAAALTKSSTLLPPASIPAYSGSPTRTTVSDSQNRMFILGLGFVGQAFAEQLKDNGWIVSGTCTSVIKKKALDKRGFDVLIFNANEPELTTMNAMKSHTHLLVSIPPVVGIGDLAIQHKQLLRSTLMDGNLQWLGYLSSTSIYGDSGGAWVDEDYPASPTTESAKLRLIAEEEWSSLANELGLSMQVFRLGGIYGPGRSAVDTIVNQGALSEGQKKRTSKKFTSRVHVDDICQALMASINLPSSKRTYNIVDDNPAPREEVFAYAQNLAEKKWPGKIKQSTGERNELLTPNAHAHARDVKRVSNARMKTELGLKLLHPSYKSGLQSIIDQMESPCK